MVFPLFGDISSLFQQTKAETSFNLFLFKMVESLALAILTKDFTKKKKTFSLRQGSLRFSK